MGGELQRSRLNEASGYSRKAHCIGKPSYLESNSGSLHVSIEGVYSAAEKIEDRGAIGEETTQKNAEKRTYLERIRNTMQKPVEGLLAQFLSLYKGGYRKKSHSRTPRNLPHS